MQWEFISKKEKKTKEEENLTHFKQNYSYSFWSYLYVDHKWRERKKRSLNCPKEYNFTQSSSTIVIYISKFQTDKIVSDSLSLLFKKFQETNRAINILSFIRNPIWKYFIHFHKKKRSLIEKEKSFTVILSFKCCANRKQSIRSIFRSYWKEKYEEIKYMKNYMKYAKIFPPFFVVEKISYDLEIFFDPLKICLFYLCGILIFDCKIYIYLYLSTLSKHRK